MSKKKGFIPFFSSWAVVGIIVAARAIFRTDPCPDKIDDLPSRARRSGWC
ncbi:MAG: hypothetical protein Q7S36_01470 [Candidatus Liptonbacteria bacterium]|nr:hypothetical protein [Candidatus Liptonbacteria bacterium]